MRVLALLGLLVPATALVGFVGSDWFGAASKELIEVRAEPLVRRISASGELESAVKISIGPPPIRRTWNFTITDLTDEGVQVEQGEPLISFDTQKLHEDLQVKQSELATARKELEKTKLEQSERVDRLLLEQVELRAEMVRLRQKLDVPANLQKRIELDQLKVDQRLKLAQSELLEERIDVARELQQTSERTASNKVAKLERIVSQLAEAIDKMTVNAPAAGFVVHVPDWQGDKPKAGDNVWLGRQLIEIADLSRMEVAAEVAEPDAAHVRAGQRVEVRLDASPERVFKGSVRKIGRLFRIKSDEVPIVIFDAQIELEDTDQELMRPGMAAKVEILSESNDVVIQVPERAVHITSAGPVLKIEREGRAQTVSVELGHRASGHVVVLDGLKEGDKVVVPASGA